MCWRPHFVADLVDRVIWCDMHPRKEFKNMYICEYLYLNVSVYVYIHIALKKIIPTYHFSAKKLVFKM